MLLPILAAAALAVTPSLESGLVFWDDYTAPRSATVSAAGAKVVRIHARAGWLKVRGRDGAANVKATGTARASNESWLPEIKLTAERSGDVIDVTVDIPERSFVGVGRFYRALDLEVELPANVAIEIEDSSGDLEVRDVAALDVEDSSGDIALANIGGALRVRDSSGEIRVDGVRGDVQLRDSSGDMIVERVVGSVTVIEDSSGEIDVRDVSGSVHVERDSSGSISAADVGGDFIVDRDGSGGIEHHGVRGAVKLPRGRRG